MYEITVRYRGPSPRGLRAAYNAASREALLDAGRFFHQHMVESRFTVAFGKEVGYTPRSGEQTGISQKRFWRSYTGRKLKEKGHRRPFVWSGDTEREIVNSTPNYIVTRNKLKIRYRASTVFNFRPQYASEFTRVLPKEQSQLGRIYDWSLDKRLNAVG